MRAEKLVIHNFMQIKTAIVVFDKPGVTLVKGKVNAAGIDGNGAGKSTIFVEAILWALWGSVLRSHKADKVIRRGQKDAAKVLFKFELRKKKITVARARTKGQEICSLLIDGLPVHVDADLETVNAAIRSLIGISMKSFLFCFCSGQDGKGGALPPIARMKDAEAKAILEDVFDMKWIDLAQTTAKTEYDRARILVEGSVAEKARQESKITDYKEAINELKQHLASAESAEQKRRKEAKRLIVDARKEAETATDLLAAARRKTPVDTDTLDAKFSKLQIRQEKNKRQQGKTVNEIEAIADSISNAAPVCKICRRPWKTYHHDAETLADSRLRLKKTLAGIRSEIDSTEKEIKSINSKVREAISVNAEQKSKIHRLETEAKRIKQVVARLEKTATETQGTDEQTTLLKTSIEKKKKAIHDARVSCGELQLVIETDSIERDRLKFWAQVGFSDKGIKSFLMDQHAAEITKKANEIAAWMNAGVSIKVSMTEKLANGSIRDRFCVDADYVQGAGDYEMGSGGESARVDLCVNEAVRSFARAKIGGLNYEVFDEALTYLDDSGKAEFIKFLHKMGQTRSIYVISNDGTIRTAFNKELTVRKTKEGSVIQE